jgi:hypothetical protein
MVRMYHGRGGPKNRPQRYPCKLTVYISQEAMDELKDMADPKGNVWPATVARRAIMKDIYIHKAQKAKDEQIDKGIEERKAKRSES